MQYIQWFGNIPLNNLEYACCSGRSKEDGSGMYRVRSKEMFLVSSEVF